MNKLLISVDYDGTYSADPATFDLIISELQANGHEVMIITARGDNDPVKVNSNLGIKVYYTEGADKDPYMRDTHGINIDIWIEDRPQSVGKVDSWEYNAEERYWYQPCDCCTGSGKQPDPDKKFSLIVCSDCGGSGEWRP